MDAMNFSLDFGAIIIAAVVGALSTYVTMWRTNIVLETRMTQISKTLEKFTDTVDRLSTSVDQMAGLPGNVNRLLDRVGVLEQKAASTETKIDMLATNKFGS